MLASLALLRLLHALDLLPLKVAEQHHEEEGHIVHDGVISKEAKYVTFRKLSLTLNC